MGLFNDFFKDKQDLLFAIENLCAKHSFDLLKRLKKEKEKANFLSVITELQYGLFFDKLGATIRYEQEISRDSGLTPDWNLQLNNQTIIAEVGRLNPAQNVQRLSDIDEALSGALKEIKLSYYVHVSYQPECVNLCDFDIHFFKEFVEEWLSNDREVGDQAIFFDFVQLKVTKKNTGNDSVLFLGDIRSIDRNSLRLKGDKSLLIGKMNKYGLVADKYDLPLIVCLSLHLETWFNEEDISLFFYGPRSEFGDDNEYNQFNEYYPGAIFYEISKGYFYANESCKRNVSGVLLRRQDKFIYYHNYYHANRLSDINARLLMKVSYW